MPNSSAFPDARSCPSQKCFLFLVHHPLQHRQLLQLGQSEDPISTMAEAVSQLPLRVRSTVADLNLLKEEIGLEGGSGGKVRPLKATVL